MICHLVAKTKGPHRLNSSTQRLLQSIPVENERRLYLGFLYQLNIVMWVLLFMDGAKDSTIWLYNTSERQRERERERKMEHFRGGVGAGGHGCHFSKPLPWATLTQTQEKEIDNSRENRRRQELREHDMTMSNPLDWKRWGKGSGRLRFSLPTPRSSSSCLWLESINYVQFDRPESCSSVETRDRRFGQLAVTVDQRTTKRCPIGPLPHLSLPPQST